MVVSEQAVNGRPPMLVVEDMIPLRWPVKLGAPINRQLDAHVYDPRRVLPGVEMAYQAARNVYSRARREALLAGADDDPQAYRFYLEDALLAVTSDMDGKPSMQREEAQRIPSDVIGTVLLYLRWWVPLAPPSTATEGAADAEGEGESDGPPPNGAMTAGAGSSPRRTDSPRSAASAPTASDGA